MDNEKIARTIEVTDIKDIPNVKQLVRNGEVTYRGLGMGKLFDDFYELAGETGFRIKVKGKEYFITSSDFDKLKRYGKIGFNAPYRRGNTMDNEKIAKELVVLAKELTAMGGGNGRYSIGDPGRWFLYINFTFKNEEWAKVEDLHAKAVKEVQMLARLAVKELGAKPDRPNSRVRVEGGLVQISAAYPLFGPEKTDEGDQKFADWAEGLYLSKWS